MGSDDKQPTDRAKTLASALYDNDYKESIRETDLLPQIGSGYQMLKLAGRTLGICLNFNIFFSGLLSFWPLGPAHGAVPSRP